MSDSFRPHGLYSPRNSPGWNTGVGSLSLLQGIFPTQGLNPGLPNCRRILYQLSHKGSPWQIGRSSISALPSQPPLPPLPLTHSAISAVGEEVPLFLIQLGCKRESKLITFRCWVTKILVILGPYVFPDTSGRKGCMNEWSFGGKSEQSSENHVCQLST